MPFLNEEIGVNTVEDALAGARDIVANNLRMMPQYGKTYES